jgi:hypothetical protein
MTETTIITENTTDGSTTVIEIITTDEGASSVEEIIDAFTDDAAFETAQNESVTEYETDAADLTTGNFELASDPIAEEVYSGGEFHLAGGAVVNEETEPTDSSEIEAAAHAEAAREAQEAADEFVAQGDYAAAAEARETAENEAWQAGDNSMLGSSDSSDLEYAAYQQENAEYHEEQQAIHAQQGDYEAAREDASNAAYATQDADWYAGGADHSGQAQAEETQMDWAVWEQGNAEYNAQAAGEYLAEGDVENAEYYAAEAVEHQEAADHYGDLGEHGGHMAVYDASSEAATGGSYDAADYSSSYDYSSTDTSLE